jgi:hypothetical protein
MAENVQTEVTTANNAELEAKLAEAIKRAEIAEAEAAKQKGLKDNYAKENAEYRRKAEAQMSDEDKKAQELQALIDGKASLEAEVAQLKLEKEFAANGFSADETEKLIKGNFAVKDIADIIKARCEEAVKSAKAEATKSSTADAMLGVGTANAGDGRSDFQKHQDSKQNKSTIVEL